MTAALIALFLALVATCVGLWIVYREFREVREVINDNVDLTESAVNGLEARIAITEGRSRDNHVQILHLRSRGPAMRGGDA